MISLIRLAAGEDELTDELALFWPKTMAWAPASNRIAVRRVRIMLPLF